MNWNKPPGLIREIRRPSRQRGHGEEFGQSPPKPLILNPSKGLMARRKCEIPRNFQRTPIGVRPERTRHEQHEVLEASRTIFPTRGRNREQGKAKEHLNLSQAIWNEFKMHRKAKTRQTEDLSHREGKSHRYLW